MLEMRLYRHQDRFRPAEVRRPRQDGQQHQAAGVTPGHAFVRVLVQLGMSFALTTVAAVGIFIVIRYVAWVG